MSESDAGTTEVTETETQEPAEPKPTETVEFWKQKAREQESRAKSNAAAAKRLSELEEAQKSDAEKAADRLAKADAEVAAIPAKVAEALKAHLVEIHNIDAEDADLLLNARDPETLLKQVSRLLGSTSDKRRTRSNSVPREGNNPTATSNDEAAFARDLLSG